MELYHKKINTRNKKEKNRYYNRYNTKDNDITEKLNKSIYLQKIIKTKHISNPKTDLNLTAQNFNKTFTNVENLFNDENSKKKAIKYVIQIGKKNPAKPSLNKNIYQLLNYQSKKYKTIENDNKTKENIEINPLDMDMDLTPSDDDNNNMNNNMNYITRLRQKNEPNNRISKSLEKRNLRKNENRNIKIVNNETEDLIKLVEDLQEINNDLRKESNKKNNEIIILKNELNNLQKELDEKIAEHDNEIEQIL